MTPWRLAQGEKLYRDIHFPHGPLGPYLAAASDGIVGRSLPARIALAAVIALLHLAALERLSRRVLSPWRAALAISTAVAAAMFLRPGGWLFPFSLDTALAVTALTWACVLHDRAESEGRGGAAGLCLAAALLARPEMGVAAVAVFAFAVATRASAPPAARRVSPGGRGRGVCGAVPRARARTPRRRRLAAIPRSSRGVPKRLPVLRRPRPDRSPGRGAAPGRPRPGSLRGAPRGCGLLRLAIRLAVPHRRRPSGASGDRNSGGVGRHAVPASGVAGRDARPLPAAGARDPSPGRRRGRGETSRPTAPARAAGASGGRVRTRCSGSRLSSRCACSWRPATSDPMPRSFFPCLWSSRSPVSSPSRTGRHRRWAGRCPG